MNELPEGNLAGHYFIEDVWLILMQRRSTALIGSWKKLAMSAGISFKVHPTAGDALLDCEQAAKERWVCVMRTSTKRSQEKGESIMVFEESHLTKDKHKAALRWHKKQGTHFGFRRHVVHGQSIAWANLWQSHGRIASN